MMKRLIQLMLAIFIALPAFSQSVVLDGPGVPQQPGEVTVGVDFSGFASVGAATLRIEYDTDLLTYDGYSNLACATGNLVMNELSWGLQVSWTDNIEVSCGFTEGRFIDLHFDYLGGFDAELSFSEHSEVANAATHPISPINWIGTTIVADTETVFGTIDINYGTLAAAVPGDPVSLPIHINGFVSPNEAYSFDLQIQFDQEKLTYNAPTGNALGFIVNENQGIIHLEVADANDPIDFDADPVIYLNFDYQGGGLAEVAFKSGSFVLDEDGQVLSTNFVSSGVNDDVTNLGQLAIEKVYSAGTTATGLPALEEVAVTATGLSGEDITALTVKIDYDDGPQELKYVNFIPGLLGGGWTFIHSSGSLTFIRVNQEGFTIDDGILFTLRFEYSGGSSNDYLDEMKANVTFGAGTIVQDDQFAFLAPELVNGWVALAIETLASDEDVIIGDGSIDCFYSMYNLIVGGAGYDFVVESGGEATLAAGNSIVLLPGVKVEAGGYLHAYISDVDVCDDPGDKSDTAPDPLAVEEIEPVRTGEFFRLYPNPTTGSFTVELDQWAMDKVTVVEVFDLVGNRILAERAVSERQMVLSLSGRPTGMYIIRVSVDGEVGVERLIKR